MQGNLAGLTGRWEGMAAVAAVSAPQTPATPYVASMPIPAPAPTVQQSIGSGASATVPCRAADGLVWTTQGPLRPTWRSPSPTGQGSSYSPPAAWSPGMNKSPAATARRFIDRSPSPVPVRLQPSASGSTGLPIAAEPVVAPTATRTSSAGPFPAFAATAPATSGQAPSTFVPTPMAMPPSRASSRAGASQASLVVPAQLATTTSIPAPSPLAGGAANHRPSTVCLLSPSCFADGQPNTLVRQATSPAPVILPESPSQGPRQGRIFLDFHKPLAELAASNSSEYSPRDSVWKRYFCSPTEAQERSVTPMTSRSATAPCSLTPKTTEMIATEPITVQGAFAHPCDTSTSSGQQGNVPNGDLEVSGSARVPKSQVQVGELEPAPSFGATLTRASPPPVPAAQPPAEQPQPPADASTEDPQRLKSFPSLWNKNLSDTGRSSQSTFVGSTLRTDPLSDKVASIDSGTAGASATSATGGNVFTASLASQPEAVSTATSLDNPFVSLDVERSPGPLVANPNQSALQKVTACTDGITIADLQELRQLSRPHAAVREVVEMTLMLLGYRDAKWAAAQAYFERPDSFLEKMRAFDASRSISRLQFQKLSRSLASTQGAFDETAMEGICPANLGFVRWCIAVGDLLAWRYGTGGEQTQAGSQGQLGRDQSRTLPQHTSGRGDPPAAPQQTPAAQAPAVNNLRCSARSEGSVTPAAAAPTPMLAGSSAGPVAVTPSFIPRPALQNLEVVPDVFAIPLLELQAVRDLTVRKAGVGEVTFHGEIDLMRERRVLEDLPRIIRLEQGEVVLYPESGSKPPEGEGLNRPATITLYQCMPPSTGAFPDAQSRIKYKERIAKMTEAKGAKFVDYDCDQGIWKFRVEHF